LFRLLDANPAKSLAQEEERTFTSSNQALQIYLIIQT